MTLSEIIKKVYKLTVDYYEKYERQPNAVLIDETTLFFLKLDYFKDKPNLKLEPNEKTMWQLTGLRVIPIKCGEMQVVEVLE